MFEARRPARIANSEFDGLGSDGEAVTDGKFDCSGNGKRSIAVLMRTAKGRVYLDFLAEDFQFVGGLGLGSAPGGLPGQQSRCQVGKGRH